jgi:SPP1 family phage portal protein
MAEIQREIEITEDIRLTGKQIAKIIDDFDQSQYIINKAYYQAKNPTIVLQGIDNKNENQNPNNIIPMPFARRTVNDLMGYAYKPGNVTYKFSVDTPDKAKTDIEDLFNENEQSLVSAEIFKDASIKGEGAELVWFSDKIKFAKVDRENCIFEYEDTLKKNNLKWAIRFYTVVEVLANGDDRIIHKADLYDNLFVHKYEYIEKKDLKERTENDNTYKSIRNIGEEYEYIHSIAHPFEKVPLHPYPINEDKLGIFEASIPIIDKIDALGSDSIANAIDQFNDTVLLLSKELDDDSAKKIREAKVIDGLGGKEEGNFAEFMQRNLDLTGTLDATKLFERYYYELTGIPNLNDEKFNAKSGIAIAYALVPFENLVTTMEIYFSKGLRYRLDLINNARAFFKEGSEPIEAEIEWKRNLPFDLKERVEVVVALKNSGLLSDETLLKMFPETIVEDAEKELKKRLEEQKEKMDMLFEGEEPPFANKQNDDDDDDE